MTLVYVLLGLGLAYLVITLIFTYLAQQFPRSPVTDSPDWGRVTDTVIPAAGGGHLEVWRVEPGGPSRGIVLLVHGWGRNRDRMVRRAWHFGGWGFTTVIHSARDHGHSSPRRFMNAMRMAEDIEAVMGWVGEPVLLYGHSAGSAAAILAAHRNPEQVRLLFLEGSYADTEEALLSLYRWFNPFFGAVFGPAIVFWMNLFYRNRLKEISPAALAPSISMPIMLIHGENDRRFPVAFASKLLQCFPPGRAELFTAPGAGHSESSRSPGYPEAVKRFIDRHIPNI